MGNTNNRKKVCLARSLFLGHIVYFFLVFFFFVASNYFFLGRTLQSPRMELQLLNLLAFVLTIVAASAVAAERGSSSRRLEVSPDENREAGVPPGCNRKCKAYPIGLKAVCEDECAKGNGDWTGPSKSALKCGRKCSGKNALMCKEDCAEHNAEKCSHKYPNKGEIILVKLCMYSCRSALNLPVEPGKPIKSKACQEKCRSIQNNFLKARCEDTCEV